MRILSFAALNITCWVAALLFLSFWVPLSPWCVYFQPKRRNLSGGMYTETTWADDTDDVVTGSGGDHFQIID